MIAQILAVKIDAKLGNLMQNLVSDGKTVAHVTEFTSRAPRNVAGILMHLFDLFLDAPNPVQSSVV